MSVFPVPSSEYIGEYFRRRCVRQHAINSTRNMIPSYQEAAKCVDNSFELAYRDVEPSLESVLAAPNKCPKVVE